MPTAPVPAAAPPASVAVRAVTKAFGDHPVLSGIDLDVGAGSVVALLGPSGCGKTTLLRILAGLEDPDAGTVDVGGRRLVGPGEHVPTERRRVGLVFQDWALFPHLSVRRNIGYGVPPGVDHDASVAAAIELVGLGGLVERMPATLSGGEQQRVALARAIAPQPDVLLLDEPFSNLDANLRTRVRAEVHELLCTLGITTLVVTHDQQEAFVLGDQVAVLHEGRIVQQATPSDIYQRPASRWVASFVGDANLLPATATGTAAITVLGPIALAHAAHGGVDVLVRPEDVRVLAGDDDGGVPGVVEQVVFQGHDTVLTVAMHDGTTLRVRTAGAAMVAAGDAVHVAHRGTLAVAFASSS